MKKEFGHVNVIRQKFGTSGLWGIKGEGKE